METSDFAEAGFDLMKHQHGGYNVMWKHSILEWIFLQLIQWIFTLGLVSTMYNCWECGVDFKIALIICSSSTDRVLNPESGWLERQMAAWELEINTLLEKTHDWFNVGKFHFDEYLWSLVEIRKCGKSVSAAELCAANSNCLGCRWR